MAANGWIAKKTLDGLEYYHNKSTGEVDWEKPEALMSKQELEDKKGTWVWIPHPEQLWQPATLVKEAGGVCTCKTRDGKSHELKRGEVYNGPLSGGRAQTCEMWSLTPSSLKLIEDDLVMAENVNPGIIAFTLRERYEKDDIYTWVGASRSVLVSVNPYKELPIYGAKDIQTHYKKTPNIPLPPHTFGIAADAYEELLVVGGNQSVLISGESGAGKTEATKQCLKFLAAVAGSVNKVETKVVMANPLLEAFGNAKTIRNHNSSRFGKWIEVHFDAASRKIIGAQILNYLLEKSRVVFQQKNERNFHIFYQMVADKQLAGQYELGAGAERMNFMNQSGLIKTKDIDDAADLAQVRQAMKDLEIPAEEQEWLFRTTAAVLHLGNIEFKAKAEKGNVKGSSVADASAMQIAADFLKVKPQDVEHVLCYRSISVRKEKTTIPLDPETARDGLNTLAKQIYGKMFDWLVQRVNRSLEGSKGKFIGILDIFGFEIFENNSFEQLCINFANEKLQQQFNRTTFKEEEALYAKQGIKFTHVEFIDNQEVLDLIEKKPLGVLLLLDEECLVPEGSNPKFMNKIEAQFAKNDKFRTDKHRKMENKLAFEIVHYAGVVNYDSSQFMEKNKDLLFQDMYLVCAGSSDKLTSGLFPDMENRQNKSLSTQFRGQLNDLMSVLDSTNSRYIRCIKPNNKQAPNAFEAPLVVEQLRYSGVFEAVQIRKTGYPFRLLHRQFAFRYRCINEGHKYKTSQKDDRGQCEEILKTAKNDFSDVQIGKTMVLYRAKEHKILKLRRNLALETLIVHCQRGVRGGVHREFARRIKKATKQIADALAVGNDIELVDKAIKAVPGHIGPLAKVFPKGTPNNLKKAQEHYAKLKSWKELEAQFERLTKVENPSAAQLDELQKAVTKASAELSTPRTDRQKKLYETAKQQVIYMTIKINEEMLTSKGQQWAQLGSFKGLRDRKEFGKKAFLGIGSGRLEKNMTHWVRKKIPTSLTPIPDTDKPQIKQARLAHLKLLQYMHDRKNADPEACGAKFLEIGINNPGLRDELWCQLIKQTTDNASKVEESAQRGWDMVCLVVTLWTPSDDLANFALMHFRKAPTKELAQQYVSAYHNLKYGEKKSQAPAAPALAGLVEAFKANKDRSRYSTMTGR